MIARLAVLIVLFLTLAACGVPRSARTFAAAGPVANPDALSDDAVRAALSRQADRWTSFASLLRQRELFGLPAVDQSFLQTIDTTAAAARRQRDLMQTNQDDPQSSRQMLRTLNRLWQKSATYLSQ